VCCVACYGCWTVICTSSESCGPRLIGARRLASQMMAAKSGTRARTPRPSWLRVHRSRTRRKCHVILSAHRFLIPTPNKSLSLELLLSTQGC